MAAPAWATNMTTFWVSATGATTVTALGGGASGLGNPETDFYIENSSCLSKAAWTNATKGFIVDALGTTFTVPTDGGIIMWAKYDAQASLDTKTNGGFQFIQGSANNAYYHYYIGGSNTLALRTWFPYVIDPNTATIDNTTGAPSGSERWVGILATLPTTSGPTKGNPIAIDAVRYGRLDVEYTNGDLGNGYNTFSGGEAFGNAPTRRWGLIELIDGAYQIQGFHSFGTAGTAVDFRDSNKVVFIRAMDNNLTNDAVSTGFNRIEILNASSNVEWDNIIFQALGTRARGVFVHTAGTLTVTSCQFVDMDTFSLLSGSSITDSIFRRCNAITAPGSTLNGSSVLSSTVAADASALIWNVATDPDGFLDDMNFSKGAAAHHAIEFGTSSPTSITLRGMTSTGFNASNGQNDSFFYVARTTGTVTINVVGGTGNFSYKSAGAIVNIVVDPVTTLITVRDISTGSVIQNARVQLTVTNGLNFPFEASVSITSSGTVATVTHTSHNLSTGDWVNIEGVTNGEAYNGSKQITVTGVNTYTYTIASGQTSPATGTITSTFMYFNDLTNASGQVTDTRSISNDQAVQGWVRRASSAYGTFYKEQPISETIDSVNGLTLNVQLIRDE